jgi:hypothetical protein
MMAGDSDDVHAMMFLFLAFFSYNTREVSDSPSGSNVIPSSVPGTCDDKTLPRIISGKTEKLPLKKWMVNPFFLFGILRCRSSTEVDFLTVAKCFRVFPALLSR